MKMTLPCGGGQIILKIQRAKSWRESSQTCRLLMSQDPFIFGRFMKYPLYVSLKISTFLRESTVYRWIKEAGMTNPGNRKIVRYSDEFRDKVIEFARINNNFVTRQHFMIPDSTLRCVCNLKCWEGHT